MICFIVNVRNEVRALVASLVNSLGQIYPTAEILLIYDGIPKMGFVHLTELESLVQLKRPENGGEWTHNYLRMALTHVASDHYIKIDPDALALKEAVNLPDGECLFGQYKENALGAGIVRFVKGGVLGFTRTMAERIVSEEWMLNPEFKSNPKYGNYNDIMLSYAMLGKDVKFVLRDDFAIGIPANDMVSFWHK